MSHEPTIEPDLQAPQLPSLDVDIGRARLQALLFDEPQRAVRVGRFALDQRLGSGGMSTVWRAFDDKLGRAVAIKFLRSERAHAHGVDRLLREAQALARLSHPNVIPVFDVGQHDGRVWVAMEYIPGRTLREWVTAEQPPARVRLETWLAAGRGLAAVHAAGLIHRDIKPDNIMIGDDGRVRLIDFGLVRSLSEPADRAATTTEGELEPGSSGGSTDTPLTETAQFVGTPAYAAPEQREARTVDARADQFAFCVALVEALTGKRASADPRALETGLGKRVDRALARGLAREPEQRFDGMLALLAALTPPSRRWLLPAVSVLALLATVTAGLAGVFDPNAALVDPCAAAADDLHAVWTEPRRAQLSEPGVVTLLDDWTTRWAGVATRACEEVHVNHQRSPESLDRRRSCLDSALAQLDALLVSTATGTRDAATLVSAIAQLDQPEACSRPYVLDGDAPPLTPAQTEVEAKLRVRLFELIADLDGLSVEARASELDGLHARAVEHDLLDLRGQIARAASDLAMTRGDVQAARDHAGEALDVAERIADPARISEAWDALGLLALDLDLDLDRARWLSARELSIVDTLPDSDPNRAKALHLRARLRLAEGELEQALADAEAALKLLEQIGLASSWHQAAVLRTLAELYARRGRAADAEAAHARAASLELSRTRDALLALADAGDRSFEQGLTLVDAGELEQAKASFERALPEYERRSGPRSRDVAKVHAALVNVSDGLGDLQAAQAHARELDAILRASASPLDFDRFYPATASGLIAFRQRRFADAVTEFERALILAEAELAPNSIELAAARMNLGEALDAAGRSRQATQLLLQALAVFSEQLGAEHPHLAVAHKGLGAALLHAGDVEGARAQLELALHIHEREPSSVVEAAETRRLLAEALAAQGQLTDARTQAELALASYAALGPEFSAVAMQLRAWLDRLDHPTPTEQQP